MNVPADPAPRLDFASITDAETLGVQLTALYEQRRDENGIPRKGDWLSPGQLGALTGQSPARIDEWLAGALIPPDETALQGLLLALGATADERRAFFAALAPLWKEQQRVGPATRRGPAQVPNVAGDRAREIRPEAAAVGVEPYLIAVAAGVSASFFQSLASMAAEDAYSTLKKSIRSLRRPLTRRRRHVLLHFRDYDVTLDVPRDFDLFSVEKLMEIPAAELRGATYRWDAKTNEWRKR